MARSTRYLSALGWVGLGFVVGVAFLSWRSPRAVALEPEPSVEKAKKEVTGIPIRADRAAAADLKREVARNVDSAAVETGPGRRDFGAEVRRLATEVDLEQRMREGDRLFSDWGRVDPELALDWLLEYATEQEQRVWICAVMKSWGDLDPVAAAEGAAGLPDGAVRRDAYASIINPWLGRDMKRATEWLESIEPDPDLDSAVFGVATFGHISPDVAMTWAERIFDGPMRERAVIDVMLDWAHRDPSAALDYYETSPTLAAELRAKVEDAWRNAGLFK